MRRRCAGRRNTPPRSGRGRRPALPRSSWSGSLACRSPGRHPVSDTSHAESLILYSGGARPQDEQGVVVRRPQGITDARSSLGIRCNVCAVHAGRMLDRASESLGTHQDVLCDAARSFVARLLRRGQLLTELCSADPCWCDSRSRRHRLLHDSTVKTGRRSAR